eukprot:2114575-Rhodomonas_salina.1
MTGAPSLCLAPVPGKGSLGAGPGGSEAGSGAERGGRLVRCSACSGAASHSPMLAHAGAGALSPCSSASSALTATEARLTVAPACPLAGCSVCKEMAASATPVGFVG